MLHFAQIVLHQIEPVNTLLEVLRQDGKQGRDLGVLEMLKLGNHVIAFLAGLDPVDEILQTAVPQAEVVDALGKHPGKEKSVIPDVFAHLALAVERRRWAEYR